MPTAGLEQTANSPQKTANSESGGAEFGAVGARNDPIDADLARLIDTWPTLVDETKRAILMLAETATADAD